MRTGWDRLSFNSSFKKLFDLLYTVSFGSVFGQLLSRDSFCVWFLSVSCDIFWATSRYQAVFSRLHTVDRVDMSRKNGSGPFHWTLASLHTEEHLPCVDSHRHPNPAQVVQVHVFFLNYLIFYYYHISHLHHPAITVHALACWIS